MKASKKLSINTIIFESNDPLVLIKGSIKEKSLSYDSDIIITHSQLNNLINLLRKENPDFDFEKFLTCEKVSESHFVYTAELPTLEYPAISIDKIQFKNELREIRA